MLLYVDGKSNGGNQETINGASNVVLTGAIYSPSNNVQVTGSAASTGCLEYVALTLTISGSAFQGCVSQGTTIVATGGGGAAALVE